MFHSRFKNTVNMEDDFGKTSQSPWQFKVNQGGINKTEIQRIVSDQEQAKTTKSLLYFVKPCAMLASLTGMAPIAVDQSKGHFFSLTDWPQRTIRLLFVGTFAYLLVVFFAKSFNPLSMFSGQKNFQTYAKMEISEGGIAGAVMVFGSLTSPCSTMALMISSLIRMKKFGRLFEAMEKIHVSDDRNMKWLGLFRWRGHFLCFESLAMVVLGIAWVGYVLTGIISPNTVVMASTYEHGYIMALGYCWQSFVGDALFHCMMAVTAHGFGCLVNRNLQLLVERCEANEESTWLDRKNYDNLEENLERLRVTHGKLCILVQMIGDCFSPWLFIVCLSCLALVISASFELISHHAEETYGVTWHQIAGPVFFLMMRLLMLCNSATKAKEKNEETSLILTCFQGRAIDDRSQLQIIRFNAQCTESKTTISACGYFDVNKGLVLGLLGNFCSYLIVLVELGRDDQTARTPD